MQMGSGSKITIRLLGTPEVEGLPTGVVFPGKGFQLLAILARSHSQPLQRRTVASQLWNGATDRAALTNLRQLLSRIRKFLPHLRDLIVADASTISLGAQASEIDLCSFDAWAKNGDFSKNTACLGLFRGDLLDGIADTTDGFDHWLVRERTTLREMFYAIATSSLIELTRYGRAPSDEIDNIAGRMLALAPEREETFRTLIEVYARNGMTHTGERLYRDLSDMLIREYGTSPAPETAAVARRVLARRVSSALDASPTAISSSQPRVAFLAPTALGGGEPRLVKALIEDIANELARYRSFVILAPHSSFQLDHDSGMPVNAATLRADYTVSGFVKFKSSGESLVLRMVNCANREIVWSGEFPVEPDQLARSFDQISLRVSVTLASSIEHDLLSQSPRPNGGQSYLYFLEGQQSLRNCDLSHLRRARRALRNCISADSRFAPAHARIAQTLYLEWLLLGGGDPYLLLEARQRADVTLKLDPHHALGHWISGAVALYQRDFDRSAAEFAEAETLNPNSADLLVHYADALSHFGEANEGWKKFETAIDLNPTPPDHYWWAGASIAFARQDFHRVIELCTRLSNEEPVLGLLAATHALLGDRLVARSYARRLLESFPDREALVRRSKMSPDRYEDTQEIYIKGLGLAGIQ